ncbi:ead/Ea22-like family protein [Citrobacter koseri]|uniref:ead/Ea22-like family protein n=1 Tax=Citrobacter koseri TaxID=545 RepID=UPI003989BE3D
MSNIDKQALRQLATDAHELGTIKRYSKGLEAQRKFYAAATPLVILALLDELEARDKQVAELVTGRLNLQWILNVYVHAYEEAKEQIAKDVEIKARLCRESNSLFDRLRAAEKRIAEFSGQKRLIGWRASDYTDETSDPELAKNWAAAIGVLPIFEGDVNTKLSAAGIGKGA